MQKSADGVHSECKQSGASRISTAWGGDEARSHSLEVFLSRTDSAHPGAGSGGSAQVSTGGEELGEGSPGTIDLRGRDCGIRSVEGVSSDVGMTVP